MNILLLTSVYPSPEDRNENVTKVVRYFAREWSKAGHTVKVIHNVHRYPVAAHILPASIKRKIATKINFYISDLSGVKKAHFWDGDVEVFRFPILKVVPHGDHSRWTILAQTNRIVKTLEAVSFAPDLIIGHWMSPQAQLLAELKKRYPVKNALILHGRGYLNDPRFDCGRYLKDVDAIGCRSLTEANYVQRILHLEKRPFICYSGVPDEFVSAYAYDEQKFVKRPQRWRFVYAGRLVAYKNIDRVIQALSTLSEDFVFDIIGEGSERERLETLVRDLGLGDKVVFHGRMPREEVLGYMRNAHCFVMISSSEVFGLVYLEAMASSCITIASIGGGIDGVIQDCYNGFLCKAGDEEKLSALLKKILLLTEKELQTVTRNGFNTACEFTDGKVASRYLEDVISW